MRKLTGAFIYLFSLLPFPVIYLIADLLYLLLYYVSGYRRKVVYDNLKNAFPLKGEEERRRIEKKFYRFLSDQILESFKMRTMTRSTIKKRFSLRNTEELTKHFETGKAVIAATGHYGNWEWGTLVITASIDQPVLVVYKSLSSKLFEELVNGMRSRFGAVMVSMKSTLRKIVEYKGQPYLAVLVSDQTPVAHEARFFTTFLNQPTAVFLGVEKIAALTGNPVVFCHIGRIKRGYYECTFKTIAKEPGNLPEHELTRLHTRELEEIINRRPELWLWSHRRWKFKPPHADE